VVIALPSEDVAFFICFGCLERKQLERGETNKNDSLFPNQKEKKEDFK
jgi:hypothetical protein